MSGASLEASAGDEVAAEPDRPTVVDASAVVELLADGELELLGRLVASSNNALVGTLRGRLRLPAGPVPATDDASAEVALACVYKPIRGERPLWDFPDGTLAGREVAAYVVSEAAGWDLVPPTVLRDGPFGRGMLQLWIEADESVDRVALVVDGDPRLRAMALFDAVVNNADRKVGHLLPTPDGRIYGVDHGICFHVEAKLRTVLWRWQGEPLEPAELATLRELQAAVAGQLGERLTDLIAPDEVAATTDRIAALLREGTFPVPDPDRPAIPWPPY